MEPAARDATPDGRRRFHLVELADRRDACDEVIADLETDSGLVRRVALRITADGTRDAARVRAGRDRIYRQAAVLGRLAHRNIAAAEDVVRVDGRWAIVGEAIAGADLDRVCAALGARNLTFPAPAAFDVGAAIGSALDAAWSSIDDTGVPLGLLHRNLQPSAIRLTTDGAVKVAEFCVHPAPTDPEGRTDTGANELYQAPERLVGTADLSASDVYSAAAIVLELVLGRPFGRTPVLPEPHAAVLNGTLSAIRPRLRGPADTVDDALDLLRRALSSRTDQRPTAAEFAHTCDILARRLDGERLEPFARRFVLQVDGILGRTPSPLTGTWLEHGADDLLVSFARAPNPTPPPPPPIGRWVSRAAMLALTAVGSTLCGIGSVWGVGNLVRPGGAVPLPSALEPNAIGFVPVEAPAPAAAPANDPAPVAPIVRAAPRSAPPRPDAPRVDRSIFSLADADYLNVNCGGTWNVGQQSVRLTNFPAGPCEVQATVLGRQLATRVAVAQTAKVECRVSGDDLQCTVY